MKPDGQNGAHFMQIYLYRLLFRLRPRGIHGENGGAVMHNSQRRNQEGGTMTEFNFYLSDKDTDRLYTLKEKRGADSMTLNEFTKALLEAELHRLMPALPKEED